MPRRRARALARLERSADHRSMRDLTAMWTILCAMVVVLVTVALCAR